LPTPICEFYHATTNAKCPLQAQYDFVDGEGNWRYGCTAHWFEHRASKQLGPGHAKHITKGQEPPPRPGGVTVTPPVPPSANVLAKPADRPVPAAIPRKLTNERTRKTKGKLEYQDMEPGNLNGYEPRPDSVLAITVELCKNGATLEEIQATIGPKHNALRLLEFGNLKGFGWKRGDDMKIKVVLL